MSIKINLLPDLRLAKIKAQQTRHLALSISLLVISLTAIVTGGLVLTYSAQKLQLSHLNGDIAKDIQAINGIDGLSKALTAQQAASSLGGLYENREFYSKFMPHIASRMPADVNLASVESNTGNGVTVAGTSKTIFALNKFIDALQTSAAGEQNAYFSSIVINGITKDTTGRVTFSFTATINPEATSGQK